MKLKIPGGRGRSAQSSPSASEPDFNADDLWLEQYARFTRQAKTWRMVAMVEAVILIVGLGGLAYAATQTQFAPYIVITNTLGSPISVHMAEQTTPVDAKIINAELREWVKDARSVVTDGVVEAENINGAYDLIAGGSPAAAFLTSYYQVTGNSPFEKAVKGTISVNVDAVLPQDNQTYVVQWTETTRDLGGRVALTGTQHWEASITIVFALPQGQSQLRRNPLGLYITQLSWTQKS